MVINYLKARLKTCPYGGLTWSVNVQLTSNIISELYCVIVSYPSDCVDFFCNLNSRSVSNGRVGILT